jgi:acetoin utilization deacetylase AcuC-like enzyme
MTDRANLISEHSNIQKALQAPLVEGQKAMETPKQMLDTRDATVRVYSHHDCTLHHIESHPECPARISSILDKLKIDGNKHVCFADAPLATSEDLMLFHTQHHVHNIMQKCGQVELAKQKMLSRNNRRKQAVVHIDEDTSVMPHSRQVCECSCTFKPTNTDKIST